MSVLRSALGLTASILAVVVIAQSQQVYWVQATYADPKVRTCDSAGHGVTTASLPAGALPHGLALHGGSSSLYWASGAYAQAHVGRTTRTFSSTDTLPNGGVGSSYQGIALDTVAGNVYWTTTSVWQGSSVRRAKLDGSSEARVIGYGAHSIQDLRGIALDLQKQRMYWADLTGGMIRSATLDGQDVLDILNGLQGPVGVALDLPRGKVYWCEANGHVIRRANLDGSSPATIVSGLAAPQYLAIDAKSKLLYWTELGVNGHGWIKRATLDGANVTTLLGAVESDSVLYPAGIAVLETGPATGVEETRLPTEFVLMQNYPNPFNPTTTISYALPQPAHVTLAVYDMLGRQVAVLVDENASAGVHDVRFDATGLSSGVYVYRLHAGTFTQARGLVLAK